ncbi:hypothetical protein [Mycolicibacterium sp. TY66]|uniref:hypothetical protein n=1 Tax=Mycolicibacterium sp. TY66 TaxID=2755560 RepID=UPI001FD3C61F|nr:hypothetical protein [Mycolicibacterium sp. TY66]
MFQRRDRTPACRLGGTVVIDRSMPARFEVTQIFHGYYPGTRGGGHRGHGCREIECHVPVDPRPLGSHGAAVIAQDSDFRHQSGLRQFRCGGGEVGEPGNLARQRLTFGLQPGQPHTQSPIVIHMGSSVGDQLSAALDNHRGRTQRGRRPIDTQSRSRGGCRRFRDGFGDREPQQRFTPGHADGGQVPAGDVALFQVRWGGAPQPAP